MRLTIEVEKVEFDPDGGTLRLSVWKPVLDGTFKQNLTPDYIGPKRQGE